MMTKKSDFIAYTCASRLIDQSQAQQEFTEGALKKYRIPEQKRDPQLVYRTIRDELELNSKPSLNLATFVTTWMDDEAIQLAVESIDVNLIDRSMYPMSTEIHKRIVAMEADMLHADYDPEAEGPNFIGTGTVGSSEAVMLAILAHKTKWMEWYDRLPKEKRPADGRIPNLVIGGAYQVCWEKVYKFFDIAGLDKYKNDSEEKCQCKIPSEETDPDCNGFWGGILWGIKKSDFFPKIGFLRTIWDPQNIKKRPIFKPSPKSVTVRTDPRQRCRIIPLEEGRRVVTKEVIEKCIADGTIDDNTIAIGLVLGTTLTGEVDEIWEINEVLKDFNDEREAKAKENGLPCCYRIPIHVDGAYGGFILPFTKPERQWDFRLSEVQSINISNHKFGLVYAGLGSVIFRNNQVVPEYLFTQVNYLGSIINDYALNFSRGSWQVICQYYNFLRLGRKGYEEIMRRIIKVATALAKELTIEKRYVDAQQNPYFKLLTTKVDASSSEVLLPNIVVQLNENVPFTATELSNRLKQDGWSVPAYTLPCNLTNVSVLRMVVKENFNMNMAELFLENMDNAIEDLRQNRTCPTDVVRKCNSNVIC